MEEKLAEVKTEEIGSKLYTHKCSCGKEYQDDDPEVYFCDICIKKRKHIAAQVDAQMASRPRVESRSALKEFEAQGKTMNSNNGGLATFVKVKC